MAARVRVARGGAAVEPGDAIGRLSTGANIDHYALWDLFDQQVALLAQTHFIRHCQGASFALTVAVSMLCSAFDPFLSAIQWTDQGNTVVCRFSIPPPEVGRESLSDVQLRTLAAIADSTAVWQRETNVWQAWGLPGSAEGLREWLAERA